MPDVSGRSLRHRALRIWLVAVVAAGAVGLFSSASEAGTYYVRDCFVEPGGSYVNSAISFTAKNPSTAPFQFQACGGPGMLLDNHRVSASSGTFPLNSTGRIVWAVQNGSGITGVSAWPTNFYSSGGFEPSAVFYDTANSTSEMVIPNVWGQFSYDLPSGVSKKFFALQLKCKLSPCKGVGSAFAGIEDVMLKIEDQLPPIITTGGSLLAGGTLSGLRKMTSTNLDPQSGLKRSWILVNGTIAKEFWETCQAESHTPGISGGGWLPPMSYTTLRPCPQSHSFNWEFDTRNAPFVNGANTIYSCATDMTNVWTCAGPYTVNVHN